MVSASKGLLIKCDVQTKVLIKHIQEKWKKEKKQVFIVQELDDETLIINPTFLESVKKELKEYANKITYDPPPQERPGAPNTTLQTD